MQIMENQTLTPFFSLFMVFIFYFCTLNLINIRLSRCNKLVISRIKWKKRFFFLQYHKKRNQFRKWLNAFNCVKSHRNRNLSFVTDANIGNVFQNSNFDYFFLHLTKRLDWDFCHLFGFESITFRLVYVNISCLFCCFLFHFVDHIFPSMMVKKNKKKQWDSMSCMTYRNSERICETMFHVKYQKNHWLLAISRFV